MNLSDVAIRRPVFTAMLSFVLIVLGLLSLGRLGTELYPPVNFPFLTVLTVYPGAGPEDIERDVTKLGGRGLLDLGPRQRAQLHALRLDVYGAQVRHGHRRRDGHKRRA